MTRKILTSLPGLPCLRRRRRLAIAALSSAPGVISPPDPASLRAALEQHQLSLVAGTIFDDLVSEAHFPTLVALTHQICRNLSQVAAAEPIPGRPFQPPYLVIIDFGNPERARFAGRGALAPRLNDKDWQRMMEHIIALSTLAWQEYGVRAVIHPHAGGSIEFADEIERWPTISRTTSPGCVWTPDISITPGWIRSTGWIAITTAWTICTSRMSTRRFISALSMKVSTSSLPAPKG
ncbi:putative epimerase/isomerase [Klebsiella pneumoniae]|uniref:Putative epimerase/isomerase n=1 Tax=Klebsiella pneumoniae TaxID=573 RepID=A0A2X3E1S0_KLEPN|nr:putative epimerase/isomerase [Klebsiella pneumoniae]